MATQRTPLPYWLIAPILRGSGEVWIGVALWIAIGALVQVAPPLGAETVGRPGALILGLAVAALTLTAINMFGGFAVTRRMLAMFRK